MSKHCTCQECINVLSPWLLLGALSLTINQSIWFFAFYYGVENRNVV